MRKLFQKTLFLSLLGASIPGAANAEVCEGLAAELVSHLLPAQVQRSKQQQWQDLQADDVYCVGDKVRVGENGQAIFLLKNQTVIRAQQNSTITFTAISEDEDSLIELVEGFIHVLTRVKSRFEIVTPFVNAAVDGTEFTVQVDNHKTRVSVIEGDVQLKNDKGELDLQQGQTGVSIQGGAPKLDLLVRPEDAVQWTLYYPPLLDYHASRSDEMDFSPYGAIEAKWKSKISASVTAAQNGDIPLAIQLISKLHRDLNNPVVYVYRASLWLNSGNFDDAQKDLDRALQLDANSAPGLALAAIVAIVQNKKDQAFDLARKAYSSRPDLPSTVLALSYVHQARASIGTARSLLAAAAPDFRNNALIWTRYAELLLMEGKLDEAEKAAIRAHDMDSPHGRIDTVLGFTHLSRLQIAKAKARFLQAIQKDGKDPLPRLGLALVLIQQGNLPKGREQLEIAVSLDPQNSLYRSYLGKTYIEENRGGRALTQFQLAKERDPNDPTPWLYQAILLQTENQPVLALRELQKAIELNNNRAVYRSRLLLDQDLAARSASLGRIYTDLGFNQSANREAVNSLQLDPANYSAHRLLADSFRGSQRNQITRASELFQAQLLQPYSSAPLQAELSRSQASISEGASPTDPGFNEYQPLFIRDRVSSNLSHIRGDLNTSGTQLQISSLRKGIGISAGFNDYTSDGVRTNNDFFHETSTLLFQGSTSTHKNLLLEFRQEIFNHGDITQSLIPENYSEFERNRSNSESIRVATRIRKGRNTWLFHAYNKEEVGSYRDSQIAPGSPFDVLLDISSDYDSSTKAIETQIVSQFSNGFTKTGFFLSQVISDYTVLTAGTFIAPFTIPSFKSIDDSITEEGNHLTPYAYYVSPANRVFLFEMGASYDDYWRNKQIQHKLTKTTSLEYEQHQQLNPKLGLSWNIGNNVTLRSSYFRTLKRALSNNVTLEPTVFNGAVQFQDDITLVDNKNSTVSLDYKASDDFSAGADFLHQRRSMPINDTRQRWENRVAHIYANWIAGRSLTIVASERHQYENRYGETLGAQFPRTLETTSQQMGIRYFPHSSWSLKLSFNHISQLGFFVKKGDTTDTANIIHQQRFMPVDVESNLKIGRNLRLTLGARNLFNEGFRYQQGMYPPIESVQNEFIPTRFIYGKLDLSL